MRSRNPFWISVLVASSVGSAAAWPVLPNSHVAGAVAPGQHTGHGQPEKPPAQSGQHQHGQPPGPQRHAGHGAQGHGMPGAFTSAMAQEGSGTAWLPAASPMEMIMSHRGETMTHTMGRITLQWTDAGGPRGEEQVFSNSMFMVSSQSPLGPGRSTLRAMASLDAVFNGEKGYPNLFQTGETANGEPLKDRQHPHDLLMELAWIYSLPIGPSATGFLYVAPIGEPAIGTAAFMHRPSGDAHPEAPISHHWNDGTHITYGVITAGVNLDERWKFEVSAFNGREPDEDRFDLDPIRIDSYAARATFNPDAHWSFSASYADLESPERLEPGVDQERWVVSAMNSRPTGRGSLSWGLIASRNVKPESNSDALNLEAVYRAGNDEWYGRLEWVEKDELVDVPEGVYDVAKLVLGATKYLAPRGGWQLGYGAYVGLYRFPESLEPFYGERPVTIGLYLSARMKP